MAEQLFPLHLSAVVLWRASGEEKTRASRSAQGHGPRLRPHARHGSTSERGREAWEGGAVVVRPG